MSTGIELARVWNCNVHEMIIVSDFMVGVGLSLSNLDLLTIGMVNELYAESSNDEYKGYAQIATQRDFDLF